MAKDKKKKKSKKSANEYRLSATDQRELEKQIREFKGKGFSDLEILEKTNLQPHIYKQYLARIYDIDRENFQGMDSVKVYSDFVMGSRQAVKDLDGMVKRFKYKNQFTALVAAVKQKHEINKDVIKLGQQLGFIENKANEAKVEAELTFTTMTTEDVKKEVENEVARLNEMANGNIIEMRPELLASLEGDEERIRKFIPENVGVPEPEKKITRTKTKMKVKLKKRI